MQQILRLAAEPYRAHDNTQSLIARAAGVLSLPYRRARSLWYGEEGRRVRDAEAARLRAEADRLRQLKIQRLEREIAELRAEVRRQDAEAAAGGRASVADGAGPARCQAVAP